MGFFSGITKALGKVTDIVNPIGDVLGVASSAMSLFGGSDTNKESAAAAQTQMSFQERMSSSAHQREVKDLVAAGLNPIMSVSGGSGSSTPSGASYQPVNKLQNTVDTAYKFKTLNAQLENIKADTQKKINEQNVIDTQGALNTQAFIKSRYDIERAKADASTARSMARIADADAIQKDIERAIYNSEYGKLLKSVEIGGKSLKGGASSARDFSTIKSMKGKK